MILIIFLLLIILLLLSKLRFLIKYEQEGFSVILKIWFIKFNLTKKRKTKNKKATRTEIPKTKPKTFGSLAQFRQILSLVFKTLGKLTGMISVDNLVADVRIASGNAFTTALAFGGTYAGIGILFPILDNTIKIKKKSISINADFTSTESTANVFANVSIRVFAVITLAIYLISQYITKQKGFEKNGRTCN